MQAGQKDGRMLAQHHQWRLSHLPADSLPEGLQDMALTKRQLMQAFESCYCTRGRLVILHRTISRPVTAADEPISHTHTTRFQSRCCNRVLQETDN
jgi:hypothetical protein